VDNKTDKLAGKIELIQNAAQQNALSTGLYTGDNTILQILTVFFLTNVWYC
jgi:hypothetical protein